MSNFSSISPGYQHKAIFQKTARQKQFDLLAIQEGDDVLDLGCGPGHLTRAIRDLTDGRVRGSDPSEGMIAETVKSYHDAGILFRVGGAELLDADQVFDVIFCTRTIFAYFHAPWFALESAEAYAHFCTSAGFHVRSCWIEEVTERLLPENALDMFESAPAAGYFDPDCNDIALTPEYQQAGRQVIAAALRAVAEPDGLIPVTFSGCICSR